MEILLLLILAPLARAHAATSVFNVLDYGAHKDGLAPSTEAFRAAIQAAKAAGGGTVDVPAGNYLTGPIELVNNLVLHIDAGATLHFPAQRLPFTHGRVQGIECLTPVPLIGGENLENVSITGRGTITTNNADWVKLMGAPEPRTATNPGSAFGPEWNHLRELLELKTPQSEDEYLKVAPHLRPAFIRFTESKNIAIEGIQILGSSFWTIHLLYCQTASVRDITLKTFPGIFTGAIYVDSSRDVRISDCDLDAGDDSIVLKAGKDADGLRVNRPCENVAITNCIIHRGSGAIVLGSETSGWIRNVVASNIICQGTQMGIHIKSERGRGGGVQNVRIDNVTMEDVSRPITVSMLYQMQGEHPTTTESEEPITRQTPILRDIAISQVTVKSSSGVIDFSWNPISTTSSSGEGSKPLSIDIQGLPEMPITDLRLSDVIVNGKGNFKASNTSGLQLHNVQVNGEVGPAVVIRDSKELELDDVTTRKPLVDMPAIHLENCPGASVRGSSAVEQSKV
jgi:polygalacturonase